MTYWWWDQVPWRSEHPLPTGHIHREPSFQIMNADLSAIKLGTHEQLNYWCEKCETTFGAVKVWRKF
jgi:hypothetical protein